MKILAKQVALLISFGFLAVLIASCASIVHGTRQDISVTSNPSQAEVIIKTSGNVEAFRGTTPATAKLKRKSEYDVIIKLAGYKEERVHISKEISGAWFGNILCGGVIGLIVDFSNGAAYKLDPNTINVTLVTASIRNRTKEIYAVMKMVDSDGQLRTLVIPLLKA